MNDESPKEDAKRQAILEAAFGVFAQYGYRRTSMADIADATGMSRPALYQHFQGKEDIARSLVEAFYAQAAVTVAEALSHSGDLSDVLKGAFRAKAGPALEMLLDSPHGQELLELGNSTAADLVRQGNAQLEALFARWLGELRASGKARFDGSENEMAATMLAALEGAKSGGRSPKHAAYLNHMDRIADVFGRALSA